MKCAFTGYRPERFHFGTGERHPDCEAIKQRLFCEILRLSREGVTIFISGMSRGVDIWAAEAVLKIRETAPSREIKLWTAIPYDRQASAWSKADRERYDAILAKADHVEHVSHEYTRDCLHKRNRWMVDQASHLLGVYDGQKGGTKNTIDYARKKGLNITIIEPGKE